MFVLGWQLETVSAMRHAKGCFVRFWSDGPVVFTLILVGVQ